MSTADNSRHINISAFADKSACVTAALQNNMNENWRFDYTGTDGNGSFYRIVNAATGRVLTPMNYTADAGTECVIFGNENDKSQYWYVNPVDRDSCGNNLHYQITNYTDKNAALTESNGRITLSAYSGSNLYNAGGANETAKLHCYTDAAHTTLDNTHLSGAGAQKLASMIAEQTKQLGLQIGEKAK